MTAQLTGTGQIYLGADRLTQARYHLSVHTADPGALQTIDGTVTVLGQVDLMDAPLTAYTLRLEDDRRWSFIPVSGQAGGRTYTVVNADPDGIKST